MVLKGKRIKVPSPPINRFTLVAPRQGEKQKWDLKNRRSDTANALRDKKLRRNNFFDLAFKFDNYGVGLRFIRKIWWNKPETYWTVTKVLQKSVVR
jgi:hypothetical protein